MTLLPEGFGIELDRSVRTFARGTVLVGGHPGRLITLTQEGAGALDRFLAGGTASVGQRQLAGRLVRAGMAHPRRLSGHPRSAADWGITVVVPARDRVADLDRCLASLASGPPVVVVDDGSDHPTAVADVCRHHRAQVIHRTVNGGPGAARNDALEVVHTDLVAFVDSDCSVTPGWLLPLIDLFEDPAIGAVAPRVRPKPGDPDRASTIDRYSTDRSALDLGPEPSEVGPDRLVRYVPSAALVVRRTALDDGFDPDLRVGEDVDLVWRLLGAGWRVRYEPSVTVHHREPSTWGALLGRRVRYGTSAGPLSRRHQGQLAPVELRPWPTGVAVALLAGRPRTALVTLLSSAVAMDDKLGRRGIPMVQSLRWCASGAGWTLIGLGRAATMLAAPLLLGASIRGRRARLVSVLALVAPPAVEWCRRRPGLDPVRWVVASVVDDIAYGCGVWIGCVRARAWAPLLPRIRSGAPADA